MQDLSFSATLQEADQAIEGLCDIYAGVVGPLLPRDQPYALVDFPDHSNIGDSAIWAGEMAYFQRSGAGRPSYVSSYKHNLDELERYAPEGPVFIHGGGNFGDIWPRHQDYRIRLLERLKGRTIIQLPQSIHFDDVALRDATARAIAGHGDFTLLVRDQFSYDFATRHFDCVVQMCPDAAYNLKMLPAAEAQTPVISFLRGDRESVWGDAREMLATYGPVVDWPETQVWTPRHRLARKLWSFGPERAAMAHRVRLYDEQAMMRVLAGVKALSQAELIVSDRLHVHIIASLMGRRHLVLDNAYGKIARHVAAWGGNGLAQQITTPERLEAALRGNASRGQE